ncbi:Putative stage IV sporulation protein YqfD [Paenibacillus konkukensis]|uniref:Stage IV sporulation protein YqfD n=1 Tax=Paenibacillus konkukensis TaxID=2020716 RepID=A0ABY4RZZ9_9BACL|nr:sporulation protein YqfD [Paenibacillus konkukensis]UQZ86998.1 Putative stage IV sporulation protein YqfD [Paenibacillus konkukensis]
MKSSFLLSLRGYVLVEVRGGRIEKLVNGLTDKRMTAWDIRIMDESHAQMHILIKDFFRLRPLLKETGCRVHVKRRHGVPFLLDKLEKRKLFAVGIVGFIVGLYLLSSVVWQVRVEGNETISTQQILQAAKGEGIYQWQWKNRLQDADVLSKLLQSKIPGTAWVGVEVHGTHIVIKVVEATIPNKPPLLSPRHLVASKNAMVTYILAEKGRPAVRPNTYVKKGDILISGILGDEVNQQTVVASGVVKGLVWYTPKVEVPLVQHYKVYTGETKDRSYLVIGSRALQLTGYGKPGFEQSETIADRKTLQWKNFVLPLGWLNERVMEVNVREKQITPEEARQLGVEHAKQAIIEAAGKDAKVVNEKILHEKTENGKVYMEVHLEVEESITEEQPIVS